ncbi:peptidase S41 family protein [Aaosphaeria arxii CBS 175.79]|uniref:Peptidase S41 family protein n=1 Tax=Aaosphaeria arxii CBS 175.79 TaxID=1450172 RepID=A0A6A5Y760_9PLEO|nr:peptidase S41 family protein [Aaosphaeria arxii CBS 175.79]KAF2021129.1 peptidase S41 family protein [Aaosphaeria arxii CBS 175.79]
MKTFAALTAIAALAHAQSEFSLSPSATQVVSSADNLDPTGTASGTGPINTQRACEQVSGQVETSRSRTPTVQADLAYACLKSVPIDNDAATLTLKAIKQMAEFQSTISYLKDPPKGYVNEKVDIMGGLDDIGKKVNGSEYKNEFDFENDIATLFTKAHDGHFSWDGMAYNGVFRWRRSRQIALISATNGDGVPKIYTVNSYNTSSSNEPSAISQINGKDAVQFLKDESLQNSYHDPDARWNAMFFMQPAESYGLFANPSFYPGPDTKIKFENGTEQTYLNYAVVLDSSAWGRVDDPDTFYDTFITARTSANRGLSSTQLHKRQDPHQLPRSLQHEKEKHLSRRYVPAAYPEPAVEHTASDVALAGYFLDTSVGTVGVLMIQTFNTESNSDAREFQSVVEEYLSEAKKRKAVKNVIDLRTNGGGKILLGYDTYLQFFPSQVPQLQSRYRISKASDLFGDTFSQLTFNSRVGELYTSPFNYHSYLNKDLQAYKDWKDMSGAKFHDDSFTHELRYNLSDPIATSSDRYSIGVTMTGYGSRSNIKDDPFKPEDIILLTDGICASTCSLFTELMVQQSGVKTIAIGGRPETGPMQAVGGTKGSLVLQSAYLTQMSAVLVANFASSRSKATEWVEFLPNPFAINFASAAVNFQDNIRKGLEGDGIPTQFLNDTSSCRLFYQPNDYFNVTNVWQRAAEIGFGKDGKLDGDKCVQGSVTSEEQQKGKGEGNPATGQGNTNASPTNSKGAAPRGVPPFAGLKALVACGAVVVGSMAFGASLI